MATNARRKREDEGPPGVAPWLVTFSDCMTLLLCFFVLLTSFSSFDEQALQQIEGIFRTPAMDSIMSDQSVKDSVTKPRPRQDDQTAAGSRLPDHEEPKKIRNPRRPAKTFDVDLFKDKHVVYMKVRTLFWGNGVSITPEGRQWLGLLANFIKTIPCRVIITGKAGQAGGPSAIQSLEQASAIVRYFTLERKLSSERISLSASHRPSPRRFEGRPMMEITLLSRDIFK